MAATQLASCLTIDSDALSRLCRQFGVRQLDLFGSATEARFDPERSDVDLLVAFLDADRPAPGLSELRARLEALFGRKVDLVTETALRNPYLRRQIDRQRHRIFASDDR